MINIVFLAFSKQLGPQCKRSKRNVFVKYERSFNPHNLRLVKVLILPPLNGNQQVFWQLKNSGRAQRLWTCWQHTAHACLACTTLLRDTMGYLAVGLAWQSGHRALLVLNNVHPVPCEVMYIAFH